MSRKDGGSGDMFARGVSQGSAGVRPLPGGGAGARTQPEWVDVTVMPREVPMAPRGHTPVHPPPRSRAEVQRAGLAESARFHESFMRWLEAHHLLGSVRSVSEPGSLPMLHLRCAPRVLDQLRRAPEFEAGAMLPVDLY